MKPYTCEACGLAFRSQLKSRDGSVLCPECKHRRRLVVRTRLVVVIVLFVLIVAATFLAAAYDRDLHWEWS
jgi:DNA-directed RNA polymerase subunit RPC12/RpoP